MHPMWMLKRRPAVHTGTSLLKAYVTNACFTLHAFISAHAGSPRIGSFIVSSTEAEKYTNTDGNMKSTKIKRQICRDLREVQRGPTIEAVFLCTTVWRWEALLHTNCARSAGPELRMAAITPTCALFTRTGLRALKLPASPSRATGGRGTTGNYITAMPAPSPPPRLPLPSTRQLELGSFNICFYSSAFVPA